MQTNDDFRTLIAEEKARQKAERRAKKVQRPSPEERAEIPTRSLVDDRGYVDRAALRREQEAAGLLSAAAEVKGLDTDLLRRVRRELDSFRAQEKRDAEQDVTNAWAQSVVKTFNESISPLNNNFQSAMQAIKERARDGTSVKLPSDLFCSGRMHYVFDLSSDNPGIPHAIFKSRLYAKNKEKEAHTRVCLALDKATLETVAMGLKPKSKVNVAKTIDKVDVSPPEDEDDIFRGVGSFDAKEFTKRPSADEGMSPAVTRVDGRLKEQEKALLKEVTREMAEAARKREIDDRAEAALAQEKKERLERISQTPLKPADNPFSLQNASLLPLIQKRVSEHMAAGAGSKRDVARPGEGASDRVDAEYGVTQYDMDEWADEDGSGRMGSRKKRKKPSSQLAISSSTSNKK